MGTGIRYNNKALMVLASLAIILAAVSPASGLEITVGENVVVKGDKVRLGDVAQFDPVKDSRVLQLQGVEISASPAPGSQCAINKDLLMYRIDPYISGSKDILVKIPETLTVKRSAQVVSSGRIEEIYMKYIRENSDWSEDQIQFEDIKTPGPIALPEGELQWNVQDRKDDDFIGYVNLNIDFSIDGKPLKKVSVSGKVGLRGETVKATAKIEKGRVITEADITLMDDNSVHYKKDAVINKEDVIGKRARRTIQADQTILANMLENTPPVKKGDKVIIKAENSELKVTATGEALQDGRAGDQVEVLNIQSGRKILATVKGSGVVEVVF